MPRCSHLPSKMLGVEKHLLKFASDGDPSLLTLEVPSEFSRSGEPIACVCFPVLARRGGMTLAVPLSAFVKGSWSSSTLSCCSEGAAVPSPSFNYDPGSGRRTSSSSGRSSIYRSCDECTGSAVSGTYCVSGPSHFKPGPTTRTSSDSKQRDRFFYSRRSEKRQASGGISKRPESVLCAGYAADAQTTLPGQTGTINGGRAGIIGCFDVGLFGTDRRLQTAARSWDHYVDCSSCSRQPDSERHPYGSRAPCSSGMLFGTGCSGFRPMELSLFDLVIRRTPSAAVPRSCDFFESDRPPIRSTDPFNMVRNCPILSQRIGDPHESEGRSGHSEIQGRSKGRRSSCRRFSIAQAPPSVSKETEGRSDPRVTSCVSVVDDVDFPCRDDEAHTSL